MKTLLLLRHAKSSWKDSELDDHDRPLSKRGRTEAPAMGRLLREQELLPDLIVTSTARRCRQTTQRVIDASGYRGPTQFTPELYEADGERLLAFVRGLADAYSRVLLIGHNPGLEELLDPLLGCHTPLPTAALAHLELPIDAWRDLADQIRAKLRRLFKPGE
jgi:phosphohistidine phosphatase